VLVRLAGKSLPSDVEGFALGAAPAQLAAEEAPLEVELALVADKFSPVEAKCFSFYRNRQGQPVGTVGEFRKENGNIIVNAINQGGGVGTGITFFQTAARAQVTVADGEDGFLVVKLVRNELGFSQEPVLIE
jgi:hypothetical protein